MSVGRAICRMRHQTADASLAMRRQGAGERGGGDIGGGRRKEEGGSGGQSGSTVGATVGVMDGPAPGGGASKRSRSGSMSRGAVERSTIESYKGKRERKTIQSPKIRSQNDIRMTTDVSAHAHARCRQAVASVVPSRERAATQLPAHPTPPGRDQSRTRMQRKSNPKPKKCSDVIPCKSAAISSG